MNKIKPFYFNIFLLTIIFSNIIWPNNNCLTNNRFKSCWKEMQDYYAKIAYLSKSLEKDGFVTQQYNKNNLKLVKAIIEAEPNEKLLTTTWLSNVMVRSGRPISCNYEECFLKNCLDQKTADKIKNFANGTSDGDKFFLPITSKQFNCSTSTLGHLFYVGKLYSWMDKEPEFIVEFGGGYGNLARCFKSISPNTTIVIIDLPEMCAIQSMFLKYTLPHTDIITHTKVAEQIKAGSIHLIPVSFIDSLDYLKCDAFISTFAISEAPEKIQKKIIQLKFFQADAIYLAGQIDGWSKLGIKDWAHHNVLVESIKNNYQQTYCVPFHIYNKKYESYELLAKS